MLRFSKEFLVGLLTLAVAALVAWGAMRTDDRPDGATQDGYTLYLFVPSAEGVFPATPVRIAGVNVGAVGEVTLEGSRARVTLLMRGDVQLPVDSVAELRSEGMLGDRFVRVVPGNAPTMLKGEDTIQGGTGGMDVEAMAAKASAIADDVKAITGTLRELAEDPTTREQVRSTVANVEALSAELRNLAGANSQELDAIADNLLEVSETLKSLVGATGASVEEEMASLREATETLDRTLRNLESITGRVDRGEGTVGRLMTDSTTIDSLNDTLDQVNAMVGDVSRLRTEVYYRGDVFYGSVPGDDAFGGVNPVSGRARNVLGVWLRPREDYGYLVEVVTHPLGTIEDEYHEIPELGTMYREYVVRPSYRFSFQFAKRFHDVVLRFGLKESSGGVGADWMLARDRLALSADLYDFTYGSWPVMDGTPNLQLTARAWPWRHVYVEAGVDNAILGARYGYATGFVGGGFTFDDRDLKFVLAALPTPP